mmetsp:Transcript_23333/g.56188  ORF Transcript_23333/g.56188 Transcript_23333/m.56188 type:complete len:258 (+) Transcript_23333:1255-2028(+)
MLEPLRAFIRPPAPLIPLHFVEEAAGRESAVRQPRGKFARAVATDCDLPLAHRIGCAHVVARERLSPPHVAVKPRKSRPLAAHPLHRRPVVSAWRVDAAEFTHLWKPRRRRVQNGVRWRGRLPLAWRRGLRSHDALVLHCSSEGGVCAVCVRTPRIYHEVIDVVKGETPPQDEVASCGAQDVAYAALDPLLFRANLREGEALGDAIVFGQCFEGARGGAMETEEPLPMLLKGRAQVGDALEEELCADRPCLGVAREG